MRRTIVVCLAFIALAALHVGIPASVLKGRAAILAHGTEVRLALATQDPRSLFRGEYSNLSYAIGNLRDVPVTDDERRRCAASLSDCQRRSGGDIYVRLERGDDGIFQAKAVSMSPLPAGFFIRGKSRYGSFRDGVNEKCPSGLCFTGQVTYGIETWFGPQGVPARIDRAARADLLAVVKVDKDGAAVLSSLLINGQPVEAK